MQRYAKYQNDTYGLEFVLGLGLQVGERFPCIYYCIKDRKEEAKRHGKRKKRKGGTPATMLLR